MTPGNQAQDIAFTLNGEPFTAHVEAGMSLMEVLRDQAGLISPKNGCAPQVSCGCCTVLVDGRALSSCVVPARQAAMKHIVTLEGFEARERHIFAHAFAVTGGLQCGFCIPGIVVAAKHLIGRHPRPTRAQIAEALNNHVCRCTGYVKIVGELGGGRVVEVEAAGNRGWPTLDDRHRIPEAVPC